MTKDLRAYCEAEIARLKQLAAAQEQQIKAFEFQHAATLGGIQAYKDILDEFPPSIPAVPISDPLEPSPASPRAVEPEPDEYPVDSARNVTG